MISLFITANGPVVEAGPVIGHEIFEPHRAVGGIVAPVVSFAAPVTILICNFAFAWIMKIKSLKSENYDKFPPELFLNNFFELILFNLACDFFTCRCRPLRTQIPKTRNSNRSLYRTRGCTLWHSSPYYKGESLRVLPSYLFSYY